MIQETRHQTDARLRAEAETSHRQAAALAAQKFIASCALAGEVVTECRNRHGRGPKPGAIYISKSRAITDAERAKYRTEKQKLADRKAANVAAAQRAGTAYFNRASLNDNSRPNYSQEMRTFGWGPR